MWYTISLCIGKITISWSLIMLPRVDTDMGIRLFVHL